MPKLTEKEREGFENVAEKQSRGGTTIEGGRRKDAMTHYCSNCGKLMSGQRRKCGDCRTTDQMLIDCQKATEVATKIRKDIPPCDEQHCKYFKRCTALQGSMKAGVREP